MIMILETLVLAIVWSIMVAAFAHLAVRKRWALADKSSFWLACCIASVIPLIPFPVVAIHEYLAGTNIFLWHDLSDKISQQANQSFFPSEAQGVSQNEIMFITCLGIMGAISCYGLMNFLWSNIRVINFLKRSDNMDIDILSTSQANRAKCANVTFRMTKKSISPFTYGFFASTIVLPRFIYTLPKSHQKALIDHELMHIRRSDHKVLLCVKLIHALMKFNPAMKYFEQRFVWAMELSCDRQVLAEGQIDSKEYAESLVKCLKYSKAPGFTECLAQFGGSKTDLSFYKNRIKKIINEPEYKTDRSLLIRLIISAILSLSLIVNISYASLQEHTPKLGEWHLPLERIRITSKFGDLHPIRNNKAHKGIDYGDKAGTPVYSINHGQVTVTGAKTLHKNYGNVVVVKHSNGFVSLYAHLNSVSVKSGATVKAGEVIGTLGATGKATGPHLHLELTKDGSHIDPSHYLAP